MNGGLAKLVYASDLSSDESGMIHEGSIPSATTKNNSMEEYRIIEEFPKYAISNKGNFKNLKTGRILKLIKYDHGYLGAHLSINGIRYDRFCHKEVAKAFIPNPENKPYVDHIDGNNQNNEVSNLRWCTQKENNNYELHIHNLRHAFKDKRKPIIRIDVETNTIIEYESLKECARQTGFSRGTIWQCLNGKIKKYKNSIWKYKEK